MIVPLLSIFKQKTTKEEAMINLIDAQINKIKKDGKYRDEHLTITHADCIQGASQWQNSDTRYPAKFNVLNALKDYMIGNRTSEDWANVDAVTHHPDNKDYDKGGAMVHSTTLKLVWAVKSDFPPLDSKTHKLGTR